MEELDQLVRRVDEDRWLASRFAPAFVRERLIALYAVNYEIARTADTVSDGTLGLIRLEWWREGLEEIFEGVAPRAHPALAELSRAIKDPIGVKALQEIGSARAVDFEPQPFATWGDVDGYLDATAGALMQVCIEQCAAPSNVPEAFTTAAGRAWGYAGLLRAAEYWRSRGRSALPRDGGDVTDMRQRARANYDQARAMARSLPSEVFPAIGYVALAPGYLRALERPLVLRQLSLVAASATGRL